MAKSIRIPLAGIALSLVALAAAAQSSNAQAAPTRDYHIESQPLPAAVNDWADQAGMQVMWSARMPGAQREAPEVAGRLSAPVALERVLQGSGLTFAFLDEQTVAIRLASAAGQSSSSTEAAGSEVRSPSPSQGEGTGEDLKRRESRDEDSKQSVRGADSVAAVKEESISEVIVTGTHIRGLRNSASPTSVFARDDIDRSGAGTIQEFVQRLPQNFASASENSISGVAGGGNTSNAVGGTGVDLRGLGSDSTLVLINGRRIAPGNHLGNFVDVSLIPLSAVDRLEIVTDGASAIYGSDAVGGVVNFVLKKQFTGAETRVRYGTVESGGRHDLTIGQTLGTDWTTGSALVSYEYLDSTPLKASDRTFTQEADEPFTLLPQQTRHGALVSLRQETGDQLEWFADATYSHRTTSYDAAIASVFAQRTPAVINSYSGVLGADIALPRETQLEISGSYSKSRTGLKTFELNAANQLITDLNIESAISSFDLKLDGPLWAVNAGTIRYALGAQYRRESYQLKDALSATSFDPDRNVMAGYAEFRVPIMKGKEETPDVSTLELSLAGRAERYSDFGSTVNPQAGLRWTPISQLSVRGTYGKSFKAPLLHDLNGTPSQVIPYPEFDPLSNATTNVMIVLGGNPDLRPEKATTWTAGFDLLPESLPGTRIAATYYRIHFRDRITTPSPTVDITDALRQEGVLGPQIIQREPSADVIQQLASTPGFVNFFDIDLSTIGAIVDARTHNLSIVDTDGVDLSLAYTTELTVGSLELALAGTKILKLHNQFNRESAALSVLDSPYNPINLRVRAHAGLTRGALSAALFVNYVDSYNDNRNGSTVAVASWTTADATLSYQPVGDGPLNDTSVLLAVTNIADRAPPHLANPNFPIYFDGSNANALGRFLSIQIAKRF